MARFNALLLSLSVSLCLAACAKRSRPASSASLPPIVAEHSATPTSPRININTASAKELETLPGIGEGLAERIIEHREKYGPFRKAEHLMMVRGISDARFREIQHSITIDR